MKRTKPIASPAFDGFYRERFSGLSRLAYLLTSSASVADEITQDAFEDVFRRWHQVDHPYAYVRIAVVNGSRSAGRRRQLAERTPGDVTRVSELSVDALAVRSALADLPIREREVVVLRYYAGLKNTEIAEDLDMPLGTVKSHLHRALSRLAREFTEENSR